MPLELSRLEKHATAGLGQRPGARHRSVLTLILAEAEVGESGVQEQPTETK